MNKKTLLFLVIIIVLCLAAVAFIVYGPEDGRTMESRAKMIDSENDIEWQIVEERNIEGYIVSGITCGQKEGIAVFEPEENGKYRFLGATFVEPGSVVRETFLLAGRSGKSIHVFWLNREDLDYAEITVAVNGKNPTTEKYDLSESALIYTSVDADYYSLDVAYYDKNGNVVINEM